jgi:hypothetical protein
MIGRVRPSVDLAHPQVSSIAHSVRERGNTANHELPASTEQEALTTLTITEYLLRGTYELPGLVP